MMVLWANVCKVRMGAPEQSHACGFHSHGPRLHFGFAHSPFVHTPRNWSSMLTATPTVLLGIVLDPP